MSEEVEPRLGGASRPHVPGDTLGAGHDVRGAVAHLPGRYPWRPKSREPKEVRSARLKELAKFYAKNERKGVGL